MACECELRRQDKIGSRIGRSSAGGDVRRATARAAGAPLRYFHDGFETVEHAPAGDLGEIAIGIPVELGHGGPAIGRLISFERSDRELVCDLQITDTAALRRIDLDPDDPEALPHVSADYTIQRIDADGAQRGVRIRAIAVVPRGRCGDACSVRHDHSAACYAIQVTKIKIAGKEYTAGTPEAAAAMELESKRLDAAGKAIALEQSKALRAQVESAFGLKVRADALDPEILVAAIKQVAPGVDVSGQSDDYIAGAFAVAIAMALDLKGKAAEPGPDDEAAPAEDAAEPKAAGASAIRADVFMSRADDAKREAKGPSMVASLPPDQIARRKMIQRNGTATAGAVRTTR